MDSEIIEVWIAIGMSVIIGFWASIKTYKKDATAAEYYTAHGALDKKRIFFSVFATTFSAFTVVGLPAMFYTHGTGAFWFMVVGIVLTPFTLHFIGRRIIRLSKEKNNSYATPVALLTSGYESKVLTMLLSLVTIVVVFPYLILQIAGVGKFLVSITDGSVSYFMGTALCCGIVFVYMYSGGAKADAETDLIQGILLVIGTSIVGVILLVLVSNSGLAEQVTIIKDKGLLYTPGPKGYFSFPLLFSYGVIFTLISISTPQVSQKLMGIKNESDLKPLLTWYPIVGTVIVAFAGLIGLYAAARLSIASPDFVTGDVLRHLRTVSGSSVYQYLFGAVSVLFISGVISAAVSTIDSLLLAITGIIRDTVPFDSSAPRQMTFKSFTAIILVLGILLSAKPPEFIVSLAQIQLAGLTCVLPCLLGPLFGFRRRLSGWFALLFGLVPLILGRLWGNSLYGFDVGLIGLVLGTVGLLLGALFTNNRRGAKQTHPTSQMI